MGLKKEQPVSKQKKHVDKTKPPMDEQDHLATEDSSPAAPGTEISEPESQADIAAEEIEDLVDEATAEESLDRLKAELEELRSEANEYLDGWQRARAEFANYKKRIEREQEEARERIAGEIIARYLGVFDDLERALQERPTEGDGKVWSDGIKLIHQKLKSILESEGVEIVLAEGEPFDPTLHEAISYEESDDHEDGQVIAVVQQGYKLGDRLIRPAIVRVAK
jgi:molecular chaperone GrpE